MSFRIVWKYWNVTMQRMRRWLSRLVRRVTVLVRRIRRVSELSWLAGKEDASESRV